MYLCVAGPKNIN